MLKVKKRGILLNKTHLKFENIGVHNPAAIREGEFVHLFYRAVSEGNISSIGYCKLDGPMRVVERREEPILFSEHDYEKQGLEDPRITKVDDTYYLTYTAYDSLNARGALAISKDLITFQKLGIITPQLTYSEFKSVFKPEDFKNIHINPKYFRIRRAMDDRMIVWDKNVVMFPRKINGKFAFLHRIRPGIQVVYVNDFKDLTKDFWADYFKNFPSYIVLDPKYSHEASYVGAGCPPIETKEGWLMIYHGVEDAPEGYRYNACAALLDKSDPTKVIARLKKPLFSPEFDWEMKGEVNDVVFPTGAVVFDDDLYIYYGAADSLISVASIKLNKLLRKLADSAV